MSKMFKIAGSAAVALSLAACGTAPEETPDTENQNSPAYEAWKAEENARQSGVDAQIQEGLNKVCTPDDQESCTYPEGTTMGLCGDLDSDGIVSVVIFPNEDKSCEDRGFQTIQP